MKKIKILHTSDIWLPLTQNWMFNQIVNLPDNVENIILCFKKQNLEFFKIEKIYSESDFKINLINKIFRKLFFNKQFIISDYIINKEKPDIIHSHFGHRAFYDLNISKKYNIPHIVTFYGMDVNKLPDELFWRDRYKILFKNIDLVLCEGEFMKKSLINLGCPENKIKIQKIGINLDKIKFKPRVLKKNEKIKIFISGTFKEKKGIPYAIEALGLLKKEYDNFYATIIGDSTNEKETIIEKKKILSLIEKFNLNNNIKLLGFIDYDAYLRESYNHHIFLSPSITAKTKDTEGGAPVSIIEMAAAGMVIVSTKHCDIPNVLGEKNKNLLVNEKNSFELYNVIKDIIYKKINLYEISSDNRKFIEKNHNLKKCSFELYNKYLSFI